MAASVQARLTARATGLLLDPTTSLPSVKRVEKLYEWDGVDSTGA
jgi:hypothetical protein